MKNTPRWIVKFHTQPLNFWRKCNVNMAVASVVASTSYATRFASRGAAMAAVKECRLDEAQVTYHEVK
jgi:anti-sigma-K factor RskA